MRNKAFKNVMAVVYGGRNPLLSLLFIWMAACDHYFVINETALSDQDDTEVNVIDSVVDEDFIFNTGFENGLPSTIEGDGTVSLVTDAAGGFWGQNAAACTITSFQTRADFYVSFAPVSSGNLYFRAYYYMENLPAAGLINIMELVDAEQVNAYDINVTSAGRLNYYSFVDSSSAESADYAANAGQWFCLTGQYQISDTIGSLNIYLDDALVLSSAANVDTLPDGGIAGIRVGIVNGDDSVGAITVFVDEVALSSAPLDCSI